MLRVAVLIAAIALFAGAGMMTAVDVHAWPALLAAGLLLTGIIGERFFYRGNNLGASGGTWRVTPERFHDEERGCLVTVWYNATTGERRYVEDGEAPPGVR